MNKLLQLKGVLQHGENHSGGSSPNIPKGEVVTITHIHKLIEQLEEILRYWDEHREINGALVSVRYKTIVAKSNRIRAILSTNSKTLPDDCICGARFVENSENSIKHLFTYFVGTCIVQKSIQDLKAVEKILLREYDGTITHENIEEIRKNYKHSAELSKTRFINLIKDCFYVEKFEIHRENKSFTTDVIVTLFKTSTDIKQLLSKFGIDLIEDRILTETTVRLSPKEASELFDKANYLVAMSVSDLNQMTNDDLDIDISTKTDLLPPPKDEPIVGVIDTQFDNNVYFSKWVEYHKFIDSNINLSSKDFAHGTAVSSIIVDGPRGNQDLDDGCGHFRVRHFGVATHSSFSVFSIIKKIRRIVAENRDIKVWNLSLGSIKEVSSNYISIMGAELDSLQQQFDIIFVVAGTNKPQSVMASDMRLGEPADSINSMVVNSVTRKKESASYSREGPVLSFFKKPDISYFGGDYETNRKDVITVCDAYGAKSVQGTSFAAPWIARKLAYLIHIIDLPREVAKALLIDAAAGWDSSNNWDRKKGFGTVPRKIKDILETPSDEIKFYISGHTLQYETYSYSLPIPEVQSKYPFYMKAVLTYFPECNRDHGVDYTNTEMDIHFGRIKSGGNRTEIKSLDNNRQADTGFHLIYEAEARALFRKWDNVKRISEEIKDRKVPRKRLSPSGLWGFSIKVKDRDERKRRAIPFGLVVTMKEMYGKNRIEEFKKLCYSQGWIVNVVDIDSRVKVYQESTEHIDLE